MYHEVVLERLLQHVRDQDLICAGDRVAIALSGGADSVALLRLLLEARSELGIVLSVAHFNHKIRGRDADEDEAFVQELAAKYDLPFHAERADTPQFARERHLGLEAAARQLRQQFFRELIRQNKAEKVATAHTLDDQAETVLLRLMRGAGTKGLAGIYPSLSIARLSGERGAIIRPFLGVRRAELRGWLKSLDQTWREDATNADLSFTRNRVRHKLLPLIEQEFGAATLLHLAETAEIARAEEDYWLSQIGLFNLSSSDGVGTHSLELPLLLAQPLAMRRRLVRAQVDALGHSLDFHHIQQILALAERSPGGSLVLPDGLKVTAERTKLRFSHLAEEKSSQPFCYRITVPGEVRIPQLNYNLRFRVVSEDEVLASERERCLTPKLSGTELIIRNWQPGDRFWPLHSKSDKKVKELLKPNWVPPGQRALWPVAEYQGAIVWVRGLPVSRNFRLRDEQSAVVVEELPLP
jgi:tRNA(Ile)-lysidine synthase